MGARGGSGAVWRLPKVACPPSRRENPVEGQTLTLAHAVGSVRYPMSSRARTSKAAFAALLTVLVLGSGVLPEVMDQDFETRATLETRHDPGDCPRAHDHRVCAQIDRTPGAFALKNC